METDLSRGEEQYLKRTLEAFEDNPSEIVKTSELASRLNVSPASVTEMIKKLASRNLVTHIPYKGSRLTSEGFILANIVKRRQLLIEILLSDVAGMKSNVAQLAADFEHHLDKESEYELDKALGFPYETLDGRKISDIERPKMELPMSMTVNELGSGETGVVYAMRLRGTTLEALANLRLQIGLSIVRTDTGINIGGEDFVLDTCHMESIFVRRGE